jgi:hypothetical protein
MDVRSAVRQAACAVSNSVSSSWAEAYAVDDARSVQSPGSLDEINMVGPTSCRSSNIDVGVSR